MPQAKPTLSLPLDDTGPYAPTRARPVRVRTREVRPNTHFEAHMHPWGQLVYCRTGLVRATVAAGATQTAYLIPPSRALWIAPAVRHAVTALEATHMQTVYADARAMPIDVNTSRLVSVSALLRALIPALDDAARAPDRRQREALLARVMLDEIAHAPTLALGIALPSPEGGDKRLRMLCEAALRAPGERRTLAERAHQAGISERTAARLFHEELGIRYQQWRQQVALAHAVPLLARGAPVGDVAAACGYASESAFTAMFRAALGQPPSRFRG